MTQIRIHGRGGQGNVTLAELIAMASFYDGKFSQAFPSFGVERQGAPVVAFTKIADSFIRDRQQIYTPDYIIILDPSLIKTVPVLEGVKKNTIILINSNKLHKQVCPVYTGKVYCVPVFDIAMKVIGKPIINTAMLGAFAKISGLISLDSARKSIEENLGEKYAKEVVEKNIQALKVAFKEIKK